jgi:hypothetical protein
MPEKILQRRHAPGRGPNADNLQLGFVVHGQFPPDGPGGRALIHRWLAARNGKREKGKGKRELFGANHRR